jgi:Fe-S oxidoreductase
MGRAAPPAKSAVCGRAPDTSKIVAAERVTPSGADGIYTEDEARREAARCLRCDCESCMNGCEMLRRFRKFPKTIANDVFSDTHAVPPYSAHSITREAYSCNDCGYCKAVCPEGVDTGEALRLSRQARVASNTDAPALHDYWLREMDFSTGEAAFVSAGMEKSTCEYVFFPGCQLGAYNPEHVIKALQTLRKTREIGIVLSCCGAPAYWAGNITRQDAHTARLRAIWEELGNPKFVFACATCERVFTELLPEIERVSLYALLAEDGVAPNNSAAPQGFERVALFDPCASRRDSEMRASVRRLAESAGLDFAELPNSGECCGYGGHMRLANPALFEEVTHNRTLENALPYIVYCANCREVFSLQGKACAHILDAVFGLSPAPVPDIDTRRGNSLALKGRIMEMETGLTFDPPKNPWDAIELRVSPETAERIDRKLIALDEVREAIYRAEADGAKFSGDGGVCQCSMAKSVLTYWVMYKPLGGNAFEILDAYYHRMRFDEGAV